MGDVEYLLQFLFSKLFSQLSVTLRWFFVLLVSQPGAGGLEEGFINTNLIFAAFERNILKVQCSRGPLSGNLRDAPASRGAHSEHGI